MKIELGALFTGLGALLTALKLWYDKVSPYLTPLIHGAEEEYKKCIADGIVTNDERKKIVMAGIAELEKSGKIKLNFISRWLIGYVVDIIAKMQPKLKVVKP